MDIYNNIRTSFQDIKDSNLYFINHHYLERYIKIISKFKNRDLEKKKNPGFHRHHIIPRCLKGTNENANLVILSPREHFIVHHLLWKAFPKTGLTFAFKSMVHRSNCGSNNITSRVYEQLSFNNSCILKERKFSEEHKLRISESQKGRKQSEETKRKKSEATKGRKRSEESVRKTAESNRGRKCSLESRRKMSDSQKGKKLSEESIRKRTESIKKRPPKNRPKKIWVSSLSGRKLIQKDLLEEYLSNGFILGMKFN